MSNLDAFYISRELYDLSKLGGMSFPNFLNPDFREDLLNEIKNAQGRLKPAEQYVGKVQQVMNTFYIGEAHNNSNIGNFPLVKQLRDTYSLFYKELGNIANFYSGNINSIGFHHYPANSLGITPHQDYAFDYNLISIFVLEGNASLNVCRDRDKRDSMQLSAAPGSLVLLRAARKPEEQKYRPFHYIDGVKEERYSLIFRQKIN